MTYPYTENMGQYLDALSCFLVHDNPIIKRHASGILAELKNQQYTELRKSLKAKPAFFPSLRQ